MKKRLFALSAIALSLAFTPAPAQTQSSQKPHTPEELQRIWDTGQRAKFPGQARLTAPHAKEVFGPYRMKEKTLAQALVEELPKLYPDAQYGVIHAELPDKSRAVIASWELTEIGEVDNLSGDAIVIDFGYIVINPRAKEEYTRTVVRLKMKCATGEEIPAAWAIYCKSTSANDAERYSNAMRLCMKLNEEMGKKIPSLAALFEPATKYGYSGSFDVSNYKEWLK